MLFDILSTDNYVSFNSILANKIGLQPAIYLTELINIDKKAHLKNKIVEEKFFKVDRNYIEQRTTIAKKDQKEIDEILVNLNILKISETSKDLLNIDYDSYTGVLLDSRKTIETKIKPIVKKKRVTKKDIILAELKKYITVENTELKEAYESWVDNVVARQGWMAKESVIDAQEVIERYTHNDISLALEIVRIGAANGWRDMSWAIDRFEKQYAQKYIKEQQLQQVQQMQPTGPTNRDHIEFSDEEY